MIPKVDVPRKLLPFITTKKRFKVAYGGRGAAKSQTIAGMLLNTVNNKGEKVCCFREMQNSIDDSVHALLQDEIGRIGFGGFSVEKASISHAKGGLFKFRGLCRNPDAVKSMHGFKKFWVEEAQSISKESLKILTPTLREEDSELWFSMNPMSSADPMAQRFIEPFKTELDRDGFYEDDIHYIVKINYMDNPWFPESLEKERQFDFKNLPRAVYDHIWLGAYNDSVENSIIPAEWFDSAVDAHIKLGFKPVGQKIVAHDPSDEGADDKGICCRHGSVVTDIDVMREGDSADGMDWALDYALQHDADTFTWDGDGLGISLKRQVTQALDSKHCDYSIFKGSEGVDDPDGFYEGDNDGVERQRTNKQTFRNKRAQYYWALRDRFFATHRAVTKGEYIDPDRLISLSSKIKVLDKLKSEVCRIPKKPNGNGLIQIMNKVDMKRLKISSPNMADSLMMSMRSVLKKKWEILAYPKMAVV